jgi:hypothetical protein
MTNVAIEYTASAQPMSITMRTRVIRSNGILHAPIDVSESVMISIDLGRYYRLNAVGARIVDLLDTPQTIAALCQRICEEFEVDARSCEVDMLKFTSSLIDRGVVVVAAG